MKVIVCGGTSYKDYPSITAFMQSLHEKIEITEISHSDLRGVGKLVEKWATEQGIPVRNFGVECATMTLMGRVEEMIVKSEASYIVAFPGSRASVLRKAQNAGIRTIQAESILNWLSAQYDT